MLTVERDEKSNSLQQKTVSGEDTRAAVLMKVEISEEVGRLVVKVVCSWFSLSVCVPSPPRRCLLGPHNLCLLQSKNGGSPAGARLEIKKDSEDRLLSFGDVVDGEQFL